MKTQIKNKIINNFICKGKKWTAEKILLKSLKELHKVSKKQCAKILKLSIIFNLSIFKFQLIESKHWNTKITKNFKIVRNNVSRIFLAIKFIWNCLKAVSSRYFFTKFYWIMFSNAKNISAVLNQKMMLQNQISLKKKSFYYYWW